MAKAKILFAGFKLGDWLKYFTTANQNYKIRLFLHRIGPDRNVQCHQLLQKCCIVFVP